MIADRSQPDGTSVTAWSSPAGGAVEGGDWCESVALSTEMLVLTIGDVCGHGEAVSRPMAVIRAAVLKSIRDSRVPSDVLAVANGVAWSMGEGLLVTAIVALVDFRLHTLTFANAGHPPPLLFTDRSHAFLESRPADLPLGVFPSFRAANYVVTLPGDALLTFYTDGVTEHARDPIRGEAELVAAARLAYDRPERDAAHVIASHVLTDVRGNDDAAALVVRFAPMAA